MITLASDTQWNSSEAPVHVRTGKHRFVIDDPESSGGTDTAPTAMQYLISALGGCFIGMARLIAGEMGLRLDSVRCRLEGDLDLDGLMGKNPDVRPGLQEVRMKLEIASDASPEQLEKFVQQVEKRCPVKNCLDLPVPIKVTSVKSL